MVNRKTGKFSMEVKKTVDKGVPFSQTFLHFIKTNQCEKLALKVLCGINIFRRAHFSLVFTYLKQDSCSTIINQTTVCPFIFIDFWKMSSSRLTMFSFLYDFPPDLETGFGDDKWLLLHRHQGYSFQVEMTITMDIPSDLSVCLYPTCWPLRAHHLRITNTLPKAGKSEEGAFPRLLFVFVLEWGRQFRPTPNGLFICHNFS